MRILLLAMPDTADVIDYFFRAPNLAIVSLAGNLPKHDVRVLDLVACKPKAGEMLKKALNRFKPCLVGMSAMTFQFDTLLRVARLIRAWDKTVGLAAGGYHATLMAKEIAATGGSLPLDYLIRGEGEETFRELADHLDGDESDLGGIKGLSFRNEDRWRHNPDRPLQDLSGLALPNRDSRLVGDFSLMGLPMDVAETSRGCLYNCKFCSITRMYGNTFRKFPIERIVADLEAIRARGAKGVFFTDDNVTYDVNHLRELCQAIVLNGLNDMFYITQMSAAGIAGNPEIGPELHRANFRTVFVGFESMDPGALKGIKKPSSPEINRKAAALLRQYGIVIVAGCIVGYPEDTRETVARQYRLIKQLKPDMVYAQYMTPYPKTVIRDEMMKVDLIANKDDFSTYDGFSCNVRTRHLTRKALYRSLKKESVKLHFSPDIIFGNNFLRAYGGRIVKPVIKTLAANIYNVVFSRQRGGRFGL
ncbi:MAG: B12-binding domain-containing radical SAM protein [Deltaproteobacteria bacterium]|nr:B12-binding domain-containing radical SAM protein [Deltaproteobacteria bacterium]